MLPDMIFLLTLFHVVIKLCYESRVAAISEYKEWSHALMMAMIIIVRAVRLKKQEAGNQQPYIRNEQRERDGKMLFLLTCIVVMCYEAEMSMVSPDIPKFLLSYLCLFATRSGCTI